jgi:hypothetical protein
MRTPRKLRTMNQDDLADQEVDVWWGSYAGRTMWPSFLVCVGLTGLIVLLAWTYVERSHLKLTILGLGGLLWLVQLGRFSYRYFGLTYRLTNKRLFRSRGRRPLQIQLGEVAEVRVEQNSFEKLAGIGRIIVTFSDKTRPPVLLEGVKKPKQVVELIRTYCHELKTN